MLRVRLDFQMSFLIVLVFAIVLFFAFIYENLQFLCCLVVDTLSPGDEDAGKRQQLKVMKEELRSISMVNEFAKYARRERDINKLTEDLRKSSKTRNEFFMKTKLGVTVIYHAAKVLVMVILMFKFRSEPLLLVPESWLYPFAFFIAFPSGISGAVGITVWIIVCQNVVSTMVEVMNRLFPVLRSKS